MDSWRKRAPNGLQSGGYRAYSVLDALVSLQGVSQSIKQLGCSSAGSNWFVVA
jgi:hypothetical protein